MNSELIYQAKYQVVTRAMKIVMGFIFLYFVGSMAVFVSLGISTAADWLVVAILYGSQLLTFSIIFGLIIYSRKSSDIMVYSDRLQWSSSFIIKRLKRIEASKIESVEFNESLLGRSRYGVVNVRGSGTGKILLNPVAEPEKLTEEIRKIASSPAPKSFGGTTGMGTNLVELSNLYKEGIISQEEFEKAKKKLLD